MISYGKQKIDQTDIDAVVEVLKSDFLTQGPAVASFESAINSYTKSIYSTALTNATSGLHLAMLALGVGNGDVVWTTAISFVASANCARYVGANVAFVDINSHTYNLCPFALAEKLKVTPKKLIPKVLVVVHMCGAPANLELISEICTKYEIKVIEDASHALGSTYGLQKIGACDYSDITVFSFHAVKMITTGEGGMVCTNCPHLNQKIKLLRSHGITRENRLFENKFGAEWYYEQQELGFNYRMTDIQAVLGSSQLKKLDHFVSLRNASANIYKSLLDPRKIRFQEINANAQSSYHIFVIRLKNAKKREATYKGLLEAGIKCNFHYIPIYSFPYYKKLYGCQKSDFPEAESYFETALTLPLYVEIEQKTLEHISGIVNSQ